MSVTKTYLATYKVRFDSNEEDSSKDDVPFGATLLSSEKKVILPTRTMYSRIWQLPITIAISGVLHLEGKKWLSKIEQLFFQCGLSVDLICAFQIPNPNIAILHFEDGFTAFRVETLLKEYLKIKYTNVKII